MVWAPKWLITDRFQGDWPEIDRNTAIVWEPCTRSHGEIIPGYARLLLDLGYRVVVLMTPQRIPEGLFSQFDHPNLVFPMLSQRQNAKFVKTSAIHRAAVLLISTAGKLPHTADSRVDLHTVFGPNVPQNLLMVEHDAKAQIDAGVWTDDTITLRELDYRARASVVVNPHDFGDIRITPKSPGKTVFLLVGAARAKRGNRNLVFDAAEKLVAMGETNFEIRLIGKIGAPPVPSTLVNHVTKLGMMGFAQMYREVENCDFIVTAFQRDNIQHMPYKTVKTTGSFQLCYGFNKPCIVQKDFATGTALKANNSLFYGADEDMSAALQRAVTMGAKDYGVMQKAMNAAAQALYQTSLQNLSSLIDG